MIIFDLRCAPERHVFEAWFASSDDYESQKARGLVACPLCHSTDVEKAPMAPAVSGTGKGEGPGMKEMLARLADLQKRVLEKSDFVGERFPDEARAIHLGEAEARAIHGQATRDEADRLIEEGIEVAPLPFPVQDPSERH